MSNSDILVIKLFTALFEFVLWLANLKYWSALQCGPFVHEVSPWNASIWMEKHANPNVLKLRRSWNQRNQRFMSQFRVRRPRLLRVLSWSTKKETSWVKNARVPKRRLQSPSKHRRPSRPTNREKPSWKRWRRRRRRLRQWKIQRMASSTDVPCSGKFSSWWWGSFSLRVQYDSILKCHGVFECLLVWNLSCRSAAPSGCEVKEEHLLKSKLQQKNSRTECVGEGKERQWKELAQLACEPASQPAIPTSARSYIFSILSNWCKILPRFLQGLGLGLLTSFFAFDIINEYFTLINEYFTLFYDMSWVFMYFQHRHVDSATVHSIYFDTFPIGSLSCVRL